MRKQMTATKAGALINRKSQWAAIDWPKARREVRRLQVRIAKAVTERRWNKVKTLQHLLTHSYYAKVLAVKRVTSNKGRKTPGVDGIIWRNARAKMQAADSGNDCRPELVWVPGTQKLRGRSGSGIEVILSGCSTRAALTNA